ncbi:TPR repeat-containing protein [Escherichia coli]|nr:TPR repeat-containing protein [Escherichia coli]
MQDDNLPKLVVCQSLSVMQGVTYEQFAWFVRQSEEQISMVILEANAHQLLLPTDDEGQNNVYRKLFPPLITPFEHAVAGAVAARCQNYLLF